MVKPAPDDGMIGFFRGLSLYSLLKALEQEGKTTYLEITKDHLRGEVYVKQGKILHATLGQKDGDDAVRSMLQWGDVDVTLYTLLKDPPVTVNRSVDELFIEALTELDEAHTIDRDVLDREVGHAVQQVGTLWQPLKTGGAAMAVDFEKVLESLAELPGFEGAAVISDEGLLMASRFAVNADEEKFAAFVQEAVQMAQNVVSTMGWGTLDNMVIESDDKHKLVLYSTKFGYVALFGGKGLNLGMARVRVDEAAEELEEA